MIVTLDIRLCAESLILSLNTEVGDPAFESLKKSKTMKLTIKDCGTLSTHFIKATAAKSFLEWISKTSIPIFAPCPDVLDCTYYSLTLQSEGSNVQFEWNDFCDPVWQPLFKLVKKFMRVGRRANGGKAFEYDTAMGC